MKTLCTVFRRLSLTSALLAAAFGCSATTPDQTAAEARTTVAAARADVVDANARVTAANAHVKLAQADARAEALTDRRVEDAKVAKDVRPAKAIIPSGTLLQVFLIDAIGSESSLPGDRFLASLAESVVVNGATLLPKGTRVRGHVINAEGAGKVKGRAFIHLELTDIVQANNRLVTIKTSTFEETADSTQTRDAGVIAGGAGVGAVIGAVLGGKKGAAIGAITGGGAGTGVVLATPGKKIQYDPETRLDFTLTNSIEL
jgi:hypothetical protein